MNLVFDILCIAFMIILLILLGAMIRFLLKGDKNTIKKPYFLLSPDERKEKILNVFNNIFLISVLVIFIGGAIFIFSIPLFYTDIYICPQSIEQNLLICY